MQQHKDSPFPLATRDGGDTVVDDSRVICAQWNGLFGAKLLSIRVEPTFLFWKVLLRLAQFIEQNRFWFETFAWYNQEWISSEVVGKPVSRILQNKHKTDDLIKISLARQTSSAFYGTPVSFTLGMSSFLTVK